MARSAVLGALLALALAGCAREQSPAPTATAPAPVATAPAAAAPAASTTLEEAARTQESAAPETSADRGEAALERLAALPPQAQLPQGKWKVGTNYLPLVPVRATTVEPGQVEVLEFFWYGCSHCFALDPTLERWRKSKPANAQLVRAPVLWSPMHEAHARLYYTLQALGRLDELHPKVFEEIHRNGNLLASRDQNESLKLQLAFARANGIDEGEFRRTWTKSEPVDAGLRLAAELAERYPEQSSAVPALIVNGKYVTDAGMAGGQLPELLNDLAAAETRR